RERGATPRVAAANFARPVADRVLEHAQGPAYPKAAKPAPVRTHAYTQLPVLARTDTSVLVLNGNGAPGAAGATASRVSRFGYLVAGAANAPTTGYRRSIVMYRK